MEASGVAPHVLFQTWDKDGSGGLTKREVLSQLKKLVMKGAVDGVGEEAALALWDQSIKPAVVETFERLSGKDKILSIVELTLSMNPDGPMPGKATKGTKGEGSSKSKDHKGGSVELPPLGNSPSGAATRDVASDRGLRRSASMHAMDGMPRKGAVSPTQASDRASSPPSGKQGKYARSNYFYDYGPFERRGTRPVEIRREARSAVWLKPPSTPLYTPRQPTWVPDESHISNRVCSPSSPSHRLHGSQHGSQLASSSPIPLSSKSATLTSLPSHSSSSLYSSSSSTRSPVKPFYRLVPNRLQWEKFDGWDNSRPAVAVSSAADPRGWLTGLHDIPPVLVGLHGKSVHHAPLRAIRAA